MKGRRGHKTCWEGQKWNGERVSPNVRCVIMICSSCSMNGEEPASPPPAKKRKVDAKPKVEIEVCLVFMCILAINLFVLSAALQMSTM